MPLGYFEFCGGKGEPATCDKTPVFWSMANAVTVPPLKFSTKRNLPEGCIANADAWGFEEDELAKGEPGIDVSAPVFRSRTNPATSFRLLAFHR